MRTRLLVLMAVVLAACTNPQDAAIISGPVTLVGAKPTQPLPKAAISCLDQTRSAVVALTAKGVLTDEEAMPLLNRLDVILAQIQKDHALPADNVADSYNEAVQRLLDAGRITDAQAASIHLAFECLVPVAITAGETHNCVLLSDHTVWCWGTNEYGQLGNGTTTNALVPVRVQDLAATQIDAGGTNTCAIALGGAAYCWGRNEWGQLGNGSTTNSLTPTPVSWPNSDPVAQISVGWALACGRNGNGETYCWGQNGNGSVGNPATPEKCGFDYCAKLPLRISAARPYSYVDAGIMGACALDLNGAAYCWGSRRWGSIGDNDATSSCTIDASTPGVPLVITRTRCASEPQAVAGGYQFTTIQFGAQYVCAIRTDGPTMCWGANDGGQLGLGSLQPFNEFAPTPVVSDPGLTSLTAVDGNRVMAHVCGLNAVGSAFCWGYNDFGQLAAANQGCAFNGVDSPCSTLPEVVSGGLQFKQIAAGRIHTCGITTDNRVVCWGGNSGGQLGDNTTTSRATPAVVTPSWADTPTP